MTNKFYLALMFMSSVLVSNAETLTPEAALDRAMTSSPRKVASKFGNKTPNLVLTTTIENSPTSYVYNYGEGGFIVVSADDVATPMLGYADDVVFDADNMPPNFEAWLKSYGEQINAARKANYKPRSEVSRPQRQTIHPLLSTRWSQQSPYNNYCPGKYPAGCTAIAVAQVMNYRRWPEMGDGSNKYTYKDKEYTVDFGGTYYDWDNMLNSYTGKETDEQIDAVAKLIYHSGVAMNMEYNKSGSGASLSNAALALINHFGYDKGIRDIQRVYYYTLDWEEMIYEELAANQPVIYSGYELDTSGHTFVIDGYQGDGYFHINWGWGGLSNGFFRLDALDPDSQGTGGSTLGYNLRQEALLGICKAKADSQAYPEMVVRNTFEITLSSDDAISEGTSFEKVQTAPMAGLKYVITGFTYNKSLFPINGKFGLRFTTTGEDGTKVSKYLDGGKFTELAHGSGYSQFTIRMSSAIVDGEYDVTPVWYDSDGKMWRDIRTNVSGITSYTLIVSDGQVYATPADVIDVSIDDFVLETTLYNDQKFVLSANITNHGDSEFISELTAVLYSKNGEKLCQSTDDEIIFILPQNTGHYELVTQLSKVIPPGTYKIGLYDDTYDMQVGEMIEVEVKELDEEPMYMTHGVSFGGLDEEAVNKHYVPYSFIVTCMQGYLIGNFIIYIWNEDRMTLAASYTLPNLVLESGEVEEISGTYDFESGVAGCKYYGSIWFNGEYATNYIYPFTLSTDEEWHEDPINEDNGVTMVTIDQRIVKEQYYNMQGAAVANPAAGMYIKVTTYSDGHKTTSKVALK